LVVAESARLAEQLIDERGLAVVDVGDDRNVSQFHGSLAIGPAPAKGKGKR
jgi:hypothetical protein